MKPYFASPLLAVCCVAGLHAQVSTPAAGFVRFPGLPVQTIYGIAGNLILGPAVSGAADALSYGRGGGLFATGGHVDLVGPDRSLLADYPYSETRPLLNIGDSLESAVAWLPASRTILWINQAAAGRIPNQFSVLPLDENVPSQNVTSVSRIAPDAVRFLVAQPDGSVAALVVSLPGGNVKSSDVLPGLRGPAYEFNGRFLWMDERGLEIGTADGYSKTLPRPAAGSFTAERMSSGWVHLYFPNGGGSHWALNLSDSEPAVYRLPAPVQTAGGKRP